MPTRTLRWSLVIATYARPEILQRCLRMAVRQTRPPCEIIVVDASPDAARWQAEVQDEFAPQVTQLLYLHAERASLTAQRNQGIDRACGDVVFLIDDDSLMYPDCAAEIMKVYDADLHGAIQGVAAIAVPTPPDQTASDPRLAARGSALDAQRRDSRLRSAAKRLLRTERAYFLPYEPAYPQYDLPADLRALPIGQIQVMAGYSMTFRRAVLLRERFAEVLTRYAAGEDQDLSYRVSRHGALVNCVTARLCHLEARGGRLSPFTVAVLAATNPAVLQRVHSADADATSRRWRRLLRARLLHSALKELADRQWRFPRTRGVLYALRCMGEITSKSPDELATFYPRFQDTLIQRFG